MRAASLLTLATAVVACSPAQQATPVSSTGAALTVDYFGDTDVVGFHFQVEAVACDAYPDVSPVALAFLVDLVDGIFPGQVDFVAQTLDPASRHLGADLFVSLPAGCYDVVATPVSAIDGETWTPSSDCSSATAEGIEVDDGATTEVSPLLSQCVGDPVGALDVAVLLNHPPEITVEIDEKFNYECETVRVCATIEDPNDDPVRVAWSQLDGETVGGFPRIELVEGGPQVVGFADGHRIWKACADITTRFTDAYLFKVQVWDQGVEDGTLVDLETVLGNQDPPRDSNDMLTFPIHTNWVEDPLCFEDDGTLVPAPGVVIDRAADCEITETAVWYCEESPLEIRDFVCPEGEFDPHALYPDCPNVEVCDDLDNDGDGEVDEGFVTGLECVYTTSNEGNQSAGELDHLESIYNSVTETWTLTTEFSETSSGDLPDSYTVAISDGPNPKGQAQLALAYVDCTAEVADDGVATVPRVTVYAYNGQNDASSFEDGSDDPGPQAPDAITNSVLDPSLLLEGTSCEQRVDLVEKFVLDANGDIVLDELGQPVTVPFPVDRITIRLVMDVRGINAHNPDYVEAYDWEGIMHDERFGVWLHPRADSTFTYKTSGDLDTFIDTYSWSTEGWLDLMDRTATCEDVCIDGGPGH